MKTHRWMFVAAAALPTLMSAGQSHAAEMTMPGSGAMGPLAAVTVRAAPFVVPAGLLPDPTPVPSPDVSSRDLGEVDLETLIASFASVEHDYDGTTTVTPPSPELRALIVAAARAGTI